MLNPAAPDLELPLPGYGGADLATRRQVGYHRLDDKAEGSPPAAANLANTYWEGWPIEARRRIIFTRTKEDLETIPVPPCIECRQPELPSRDRDCLVCGLGRSPLDGRALTVPVLVDPFSQLVMAADRTGALRDVGAAVSERARAAFALPHRTVAATDVFPTSESASRRPLALLLAPRGNAVLETLYGGSFSLGVRADVERAAEARTATAPAAPTASSAAPPAWSARAGAFVTTYNRNQGELFVASARSGQRAGEVWAYDVDASTWSRVSLAGNVRLEQPLSAVFLSATNALWVLDEVRTGFLRMARLVRIDRATGVATVIVSYPRLGLYDTQYLLEDRDGRLLLAASSRLLGSHALLSLSASGSIQAYALGKGALAAAPIIDGDAYTFQLRTKNGGPTVKRLAVLPMRPGPQRGARECF